MDILAMRNSASPLLMEDGEIINGFTSKMWVERYREGGEFRFVAPVSSQLRQVLPIGSFVSHTDTPEVMIVENHEIQTRENEEDTIIVTGRGWETYFEQRIVGSNRVYPRILSEAGKKYLLPAQKTWDQVVHLVQEHISAAFLADDTYSIPYFTTRTTLAGGGVVTSRLLDLKDLYSTVLDLLTIDNLGIRIIRPGVWSPLTGGLINNTAIDVHRGLDRSATLVFHEDTGEIINADYLWSNKKLKTAALVTSKYAQTLVRRPGITNYRTRMINVDASDLDENMDESTAVASLVLGIDPLLPKLVQRGKEALRKQPEVNLKKAEVSKRTVDTRYRVDYNVGDLVQTAGDYNENAKMRVTEFVEIEDETGTVAYPTLSLDQPDEEVV